MRYVTVSEMQDFLSCNWRWYAAWRLNRVPRKWSEALEFGTLVHDIFQRAFSHDGPVTQSVMEEAWYQIGHDNRVRAASGIDPYHAVALWKAEKLLNSFRPQIIAYRDRYPVEAVLGVEEAFEMPLAANWTFRGRPDRTVITNGKVVHQQHKTVAGNRDISLYLAILQRSMHEGMYGTYLAQTHPEYEYGGTWVNLIRKQVANDKHPVAGLGFQSIVKVDEIDRRRAWARAQGIVAEMARAEKLAAEYGHDALLDNPGRDDGHFHNSLDPYFDVLRGRASLMDDNLFQPREETY